MSKFPLGTLPTCLLLLLTTFFVLRRLLPLLTTTFSKHLKVRTISFRSIRGIEWNSASSPSSTSSSKNVVGVKVERVGISFHRGKAKGVRSWVSIVVEDVVVTLQSQPSLPPPNPSSPMNSAPSSPPLSPLSSPDLSSFSPPGSPFLGHEQRNWSPPSSPPPHSMTASFLHSPDSLSPPPPGRPSFPSHLRKSSYFPQPTRASANFAFDGFKRKIRGMLRKFAENLLRSTLNVLPELARVVDIEFKGRMECNLKEDVPEVEGEGLGLQLSLKGGLRIGTRVELTVPPSLVYESRLDGYGSDEEEVRRSRLTRMKRAKKGARWLGTSASRVWKRGLGRSAGMGSFVLDIGEVGRIEVRRITGGEESSPKDSPRSSTFLSRAPSSQSFEGRSRTKTSSSITSNPRDSSPPRRTGSFASLSSLVFSTTSTTAPPPYLPPSSSHPPNLLFSIEGPIRVRLGHRFGPGVNLIGEEALLVEAGVYGKVAVCLNSVEDLLSARKASPPPTPPRDLGSSIPKTKRSNKKNLVRCFDSAKLDIALIVVTHSERRFFPTSKAFNLDSTPESRPSPSAPPLAVELVVHGLNLSAQVSRPTECKLHREWLGSHPTGEGFAIGAGVASLRFSLVTTGVCDDPVSPTSKSHPQGPTTRLELGRARMDGFASPPPAASLSPKDPNAWLVVCEMALDGVVGVAAMEDLELLASALQAREPKSKPPSPPPPKSTSSSWPIPRFAVASTLGETTLLVSASPREGHKPTSIFLTLRGGSFNLGGSYSDASKVKSKHNLSGLSTQTNSTKRRPLQASQDDYSRHFNFETSGWLGPLSVFVRSNSNLQVDRITPSDKLLIRVESGEINGRGKALGFDRIERRGEIFNEVVVLDLESAMADISTSLGVVTVEIWDQEVVEGLDRLASEIRRLEKAPPPSDPSSPPLTDPVEPFTDPYPPSILQKLPPGLTFYGSVALFDLVIASIDPNPECSKKLVRGIRVRTRVVAEYSFHRPQHATRVPPSTSRMRDGLKLPEDIAVQASATALEAGKTGGEAALVAFTAHDFSVLPILNARQDFSGRGRSSHHGRNASTASMFPPARRRQPTLTSWDFQRAPPVASENPWDPQTINPFALTPLESAKTPLLRTAAIKIRIKLQDQPVTTKSPAVANQIIISVKEIGLRFDLAHVYCCLCALEAVKHIGARPKSSKPTPPPSKPHPSTFGISLSVSTVHLYLHFPLGEDLFIRTRNLEIQSPSEGPKSLTVESIYGFVPSLRQRSQPKDSPALWEELARLRQVRIVVDLPVGRVPSISVTLEGARLRIPFSYKLANLILNISITLKSVKHLAKMFKQANVALQFEPQVEGPKSVPDIHVSCKTFTFEATDDEIDTKLNLIWRVGHEEHAARLERDEAFDAKVAAIRAFEDGGEGSKGPKSSTSRWNLGSDHTVGVEDARRRLDQYNSSAWIRRHRAALGEQGRREDRALRQVNGLTKPDPRLPINVAPTVRSAPLFRMTFVGVDVDIKRPSFDEDERKEFMHDLGNGLPKTTEFSLLVPLHILWTLDSAKFSLRDYPIPLLNVPPLTPEQLASPNGPRKAWEFETDLVVGEEMAGKDSFYWIESTVIPENTGEEGAARFGILVAKTIMPVKTYAEPKIKIHTSSVTDFCWGTSYQPGIQDMMKVFETLTHPPRDPSERVGFWDKLRLVFHWRLKLDFEGPVHIHAKGSRSPYSVLEHGAGFVLAWSGQPTFTINLPNKERELIQIDADRLLFAIPDLRDLIDRAAMGNAELQTAEEDASQKDDDSEQPPAPKREFRKVFAKFTNGARVGWGFVLERTCGNECKKCKGKKKFDRQCRIWDFLPHYDVIFKTPEFVKSRDPQLEKYDAFKNFRSDYIHFSMSVVSPTNRQRPREQGVTVDDASGYNAFHFTPKGFAHFFAWWRLFGGNMGLPIRQGSMFPASPPPSKKFGKALATIKYRFDLSPLFISHMYSNDSRADWGRGEGTYLGIKCKLAHFKADLHQREEEKTITNELLGRTKVIPHKPFYAADVVLDDLDLRATSALFKEPEKRHVKLDPGLSQHDSMFTRPTALPDPAWFDFDDHVETDWSPTDHHPHIELHKIADCPRFNFVKRSGSSNVTRDDASDGSLDTAFPTSKFGNEPTHHCMLGELKNPLQFQIDLCQKRVDEVEALLEKVQAGSKDSKQESSLRRKISTLHSQIEVLRGYLKREDVERPADATGTDYEKLAREATSLGNDFIHSTQTRLTHPTWGSFDNVYHVQSPRLTWSNEGRNIMLKYYYNSRVRKGFEYHMSSVAVKFIREMTKEHPEPPPPPPRQHHHMHPAGSLPPKPKLPKSSPGNPRKASSAVAAGLLRMFAGEMEPEVVESENDPDRPPRSFTHLNGARPTADPWEGLSDDFVVEKKHCFVLLQPQIALRSDVDDESVVILAANVLDLQMFSVLDKEDLDDPVNARVMRRSYGTMTALQAFYPAKIDDSESGSDFVPLEVMYDNASNTDDFERIVPQADVSLQYDKFNQLRLRNKLRPVVAGGDSNVNDHLKHHMDLVAVNVPRFAVSATPKDFGALYNIVTNLLLYQDDLQQERSKRLESFIYSFDHSNLSGTADVVRDLQQRIRSLDRLRSGYETNQDQLDASGRVSLATIRGQTRQLAEELDLIFDAIAAAQDPREDRDSSKKSAVKFEASAGDISWHMLTPEKTLLAKLALKGIAFHWLNKRDSSVSNSLTIQDLSALNGHPEAIFPEILSRFYKPGSVPGAKLPPFVVVKWSLLSPVGGISIVEHFGLAIHPIRVSLERRVGRDFLAYFFQGSKKSKDATAEDSNSKDKGSKDKESKDKDSSKAVIKVEESPTVATFSLTRPDDSEVALEPFGDSPSSTPVGTPSSDPPSFPLGRARSSSNLQASVPLEKGKKTLSHAASSANLKVAASSSTSSNGGPSPSPSTTKLRRSKSNQSMRATKEKKADKEKADKSQVDEMRSRASSNRTFVYVNVLSTTLVLSYKGDKAKSITDMYDLKFATPPIEYHNRTLSFEELIHEFKGELIKAAWQQRGRLFTQFMKPRPKPSPSPSIGNFGPQSVARIRTQSSSSDQLRNNSALLPDKPLVQSPTNSEDGLSRTPSAGGLSYYSSSELTQQTSSSSASSISPSRTTKSSSVSNLIRRTFHPRKSMDPSAHQVSSSSDPTVEEDPEADPESEINLRKALLGRAGA